MARHSVKRDALHSNKGLILESMERHAEAYAEYMKALHINPVDNSGPGPDGSCHLRAATLALTYGAPGLTQDEADMTAMDLLALATQINPQFVEAWVCRGDQYLNKHKDLPQAIAMYKQALRFCNNTEMRASITASLEAARNSS